MRQSVHREAERRRDRLEGFGRALRALGPAAVLGRGYCIARDPETGMIIRAAREVEVGGPLLVQFTRDRARTRVEGIEDGPVRELDERGNED